MDSTALRTELESFLLQVTTPGQYTGGEWNQVVPPEPDCRIALAFPDTYAIGMSHHGLRVLYEICNGIDGVAAERAFAPMPDMERELRARGLPLFTLETTTPLGDCDLVGFSLQYEMAASSLLTMLDLAGIPVLAADRNDTHPIILAGGVGTMNPEPFADFIDLFLIGEGEEALPELIAAYREVSKGAVDRTSLIEELVRRCPGWYAPSLYALTEDGGLAPRGDGIPAVVERRIDQAFAKRPDATAPVVPVVETAHERVTLEVLRGCPWGCRFCQAGMVNRPVRARSVSDLVAAAEACYARTGYDEIGLLSLSTSDYPQFTELVSCLDERFASKGVSLSLPSLRVNTALKGIPEQVRSVRKGAFTIAPEAGTDRLRAVINKAVTDEDLLAGAEAAFEAGWRTIKLYFMIGL
ncbi:MAG: radical SAM protein, partial [Planctomycetota bacterium]